MGKGLFLSLLFFFGTNSDAEILELIPGIEQYRQHFDFDMRSDLWTEVEHNKTAPLRIYKFDFLGSLYHENDKAFYLKVKSESMTTGRANLLIGGNRILIGSDLRSQKAGVEYVWKFENDQWLLLSTNYVSESDQPFQQDRSKWLDLSATYAFAKNQKQQWILMIDYSKNRGYLNNIPIPLVGVIYPIQNGFTMTVGLPFLKLEKNTPEWRYLLTATPTGVRGKVVKNLDSLFAVGGQAGYSTRSYLHLNRIQNNMRLFYEEKFLEGNLKVKASGIIRIGFAAGYAFDRDFYEAKQIYIVNRSRTRLASDFYGIFSLEVDL